MRRSLIFFALVALSACYPYDNRDGEFYAGPVDPVNFAPTYLGTDLTTMAAADPKKSGGEFLPQLAAVDDTAVFYYLLPFPASQMTADANGNPIGTLSLEHVNVANAYVFDPGDTSPYPNPSKCVAPKNYHFDARTEAWRQDEQGPIFTLLPDDSSYVPLVGEVPVTSGTEKCQEIKSEETLVTRKDVGIPLLPADPAIPNSKPVGQPDGRVLAWALIDPTAQVLTPDEDPNDPFAGNSVQKLGWYNHYLAVYIDGGYAPAHIVTVPAMDAQSMPTQHVELRAQTIYVPNEYPTADGTSTMVGTGAPGTGWDVLMAKRGDPGYSPICHVLTFTPTDPTAPPTNEADIDPTTIDPDTQTYVYCLQVE